MIIFLIFAIVNEVGVLKESEETTTGDDLSSPAKTTRRTPSKPTPYVEKSKSPKPNVPPPEPPYALPPGEIGLYEVLSTKDDKNSGATDSAKTQPGKTFGELVYTVSYRIAAILLHFK